WKMGGGSRSRSSDRLFACKERSIAAAAMCNGEMFKVALETHPISRCTFACTFGKIARHINGLGDGGEEGIRTLGTGFMPVQRFSKPPPSTTRPPLHRLRYLGMRGLSTPVRRSLCKV